MVLLKIVLIGFVLLISTIASAGERKAKSTDDLLLEELNSPNTMQVKLKAVDKESASAAQAMLGRKYKKFYIAEQLKPTDGMVVALQPARR